MLHMFHIPKQQQYQKFWLFSIYQSSTDPT